MSNSIRQKKPVVSDWHPADVIAALRKAGWSLRQLSLTNGLKPGTVNKAFVQPYPKAERIIAQALRLKPQAIWPSRYNTDGSTNRLIGSRPMRPAHIRVVDSSPLGDHRNLQAKRG